MVVLVLALMTLGSCENAENGDNTWENIWNNQDLEGLHTYLAIPPRTADLQLTKDSMGNFIEDIGVDRDPLDVISIVEEDEQRAIRISGEVYGMFYTEKEYENYHLKLQMKWGQRKYAPRLQQKRDSGLLYHGFGTPGGVYAWMNSQELQIQETDIGDYWPVGDVEIDIPSKALDSLFYIYDPDGEMRKYYFADIIQDGAQDSTAKRRCFKYPDNERPNGEWNDIELICYGDSSVHIVNGEVVMRLYNSRSVTDGIVKPLRGGKIGIQSEGAEVFYRNLKIRPIRSMPDL